MEMKMNHKINSVNYPVLLGNNWAIHTTLYGVYCMEYTWLFVNAQFYAVLCISHSKCFNNLIARNQHYFGKTYENIYTFFFIHRI